MKSYTRTAPECYMIKVSSLLTLKVTFLELSVCDGQVPVQASCAFWWQFLCFFGVFFGFLWGEGAISSHWIVDIRQVENVRIINSSCCCIVVLSASYPTFITYQLLLSQTTEFKVNFLGQENLLWDISSLRWTLTFGYQVFTVLTYILFC